LGRGEHLKGREARACLKVVFDDVAILLIQPTGKGVHDCNDICILIARHDENDSDFILIFESFLDGVLSLFIEIFIGSGQFLYLSIFLLLPVFDALIFGQLLGSLNFSDSFGLLLLLGLDSTGTFGCAFEFLIFLFVVRGHSRHC
jgi:hypothetical protein